MTGSTFSVVNWSMILAERYPVACQGLRLDEVFQCQVGHFGGPPQLVEELRFVRLPRTQDDVQRQAFAIADHREFRRISPARTPESVVLGFLGIPFFPPPPAQR